MVVEKPVFEYESAADYLPLMDKRFQEEMEGEASAEEMRRLNDQARQANADQFNKTIKEVGQFSKTLGTFLEERKENNDRVLRNEAKILASKTNATYADLTAFNRRSETKANYQADVGYYNSLAAEAEAKGDNDLAEDLRNLTGNRSVIFKEILAKTEASRLSISLNKVKHELSYIDKDTGVKITWFNSTTGQKEKLLDEHLKNIGLNTIDEADLSDEFLAETFWPTIERSKLAIIENADKEQAKAAKDERHDIIDERLLASAGTNTLGSTLISIINESYGDLGGHGKAREHLIERLDFMLTNKMISEHQYRAALAHRFDHRDGRKNISIEEAWEKDFGDVESRINAAKLKAIQNREAGDRAIRMSLVYQINDIARETGTYPSETELKEMARKLQEQHPGLIIPAEWYGKVVTREDVEDSEYESILEYKKANGYKIEVDDYSKIYDDTLREKWKKFSETPQGQGVDATYAGIRDKDIPAFVGQGMQEMTGVNDYKSPQYLAQVRAAKADYNRIYRVNVDAVGAKEAHKLAMAEVERRTGLYGRKGGYNINVYKDPVNGVDFKIRLDQAKIFVEEAGNNKAESLMTKVIPGSDTELLKLDTFAKDKSGQGTIPFYYHKVAAMIPGATAWDIANMQYKAAGKGSLPIPPVQAYIDRTIGENPYAGLLFTNNSTSKKRQRAIILNSGADWNTKELLSPPQ